MYFRRRSKQRRNIYHRYLLLLFLQNSASLLFLWKISAGVPPVRAMTSTTSLPPLQGLCPAVSAKGDMWAGRPAPLATASQQSSTEVSSLVPWIQVGHGFAKAHSKTLLCPRTILGKGESNPSQFALRWIFPATFLSWLFQEHIWQLLGGLLDSPFCFLWIAGMENCMHNMLNTCINFTLFTSYSVSWPLTAAD